MKLTRILAALALCAASVTFASQASASVITTVENGFYINYTINLPQYAVSDLVLFERGAPNPYPNGYGITFGGCCQGAGVGTTTITDPFLKTNPIESNFILGIATDLEGDAAGQQHLVVFTNDAFAASAQGIAFGTLFLNTDEDTLITDITTNLDSAAVGDTVYNQAVTDLFNFGNGDATSGPNGSVGFGSLDTFTAVAFSTGQSIGTGVAFTTPGQITITSGVPEPGVWAMMLVGFGALGLALRRRRTVAVAA